MWCNRCQQDIPAFRGPDGQWTCLRCGSSYDPTGTKSAEAEHLTAEATSSSSIPGRPSISANGETESYIPRYDAWELDEELAHLKRLLSVHRAKPGEPVTRFDDSHASAKPSHLRKSQVYHDPLHGERRAETEQGAAWWLFLCSVTIFGCGAILLGWGLALQQERLLIWGIPIFVAGLLVLVASILLPSLERRSSPSSPHLMKPMQARRETLHTRQGV